jgi:hypothetical protein
MEAAKQGWRERYLPALQSSFILLMGGMVGVWLAQSTFRSGVGIWRAYLAVVPYTLFFVALNQSVSRRGLRRFVLLFGAAAAALEAAMLTVNLR